MKISKIDETDEQEIEIIGEPDLYDDFDSGDSAENELIRIFKPARIERIEEVADTAVDTDMAEKERAGEKSGASDRNAPVAVRETESETETGTENEGPSLSPLGHRSRSGVKHVVRTVLLTLLCVVIGIAAALQYKSITARTSKESGNEEIVNDMLTTINALHSQLDVLEAQRNDLQARLDLVEQSSQEEQLAALRSELDSVRTFAGLTTVKGRGIYIRVECSENTNINLIQMRMLLLINELRASGAQAISINGVRILSMTEIRVVNEDYFAVGARQLTAPYDIYAIGDPSGLYNGLMLGGNGIIKQINELAGASCTFETQENIIINACDESDIKIDKLSNLQ